MSVSRSSILVQVSKKLFGIIKKLNEINKRGDVYLALKSGLVKIGNID